MIPHQIVITRTQQDEVQTLGKLELYNNKEKLFECKTLELPWKDNQRRISCIPEGHYEAQKHISPNFGKSVWIKGVPNRTEILIHKGNFYTDILGCVLLGVEHVDINNDGHKDVTNSKNTVNALYSLLPDEGLYVNIIQELED